MVEETTNCITVVGLVNGMIGGTILILPIMGLATGYVTSLLVCLLMGSISFYTAYLIVLHLGRERSIKECILAHFSSPVFLTAYNFFIWFSFLPVLVIYFRLICLQLDGLLGLSSLYAPLVFVFLVVEILVVKKCGWGEEALAYGILSIVTYVLFLVWAQWTAPSGEGKVPETGSWFQLASSLQMAFSIHDFLVQNIIRNPNRHQYGSMVVQTFVVGMLAYIFFCMGSFAIVNRTPFKAHPETIEDYFQSGGWQVTVIELLYLFHLISVFPQFLLVSKIRFLQMFGVEEQRNRIDLQEVVYIVVIVGIGFAVYVWGVEVGTMISLNGAIVGFVYVIVIPIWVHFKCVFYDCSSGWVKDDEERNLSIRLNSCECDNHYSSRWTFYLETAFLVFTLLFGLYLLVGTLQQTFTQSN